MRRKGKQIHRSARAARVHKVARASGNPRLIVFRSNRSIAAQITDDNSGKVVCGASSIKLKETGIKAAEKIGEQIAKQAKDKKISAVAFDRNGYAYHGQVKALAEAARKAGLTF